MAQNFAEERRAYPSGRALSGGEEDKGGFGQNLDTRSTGQRRSARRSSLQRRVSGRVESFAAPPEHASSWLNRVEVEFSVLSSGNAFEEGG